MYKLPTRQELLEAGSPYGQIYNGTPRGRMDTEWLRTNPDVVVYTSNEPERGGNEIVQVVEVPGRDCLFCVWHQDSIEMSWDHRIMYSRSKDGNIWEEGRMLVGCRPGKIGEDYMAGLPYVIATPSGRIYVFWTQETEESRPIGRLWGIQRCCYTDDCGDTWSEPVDVPRNIKTPWEPEGRGDVKIMLVVQNAFRLKDGRYMCGFTQWVDPEIFPVPYLGGIGANDVRTYFAIFENIAEDPEPEDIRITWAPDDRNGLCLSPVEPPFSLAEEPFVVQLPNDWLFAVLRTIKGCIYYTVSEDLGHTWRELKPLRFADGELFVHPRFTPFFCEYDDGRYMLLYTGQSGEYKDMYNFRDRILQAFGEFAPEEEQPIRFQEKGTELFYLDVAVGPRMGNVPEINMQASFTRFHGKPMLWYSDRKHYVLGKQV